MLGGCSLAGTLLGVVLLLQGLADDPFDLPVEGFHLALLLGQVLLVLFLVLLKLVHELLGVALFCLELSDFGHPLASEGFRLLLQGSKFGCLFLQCIPDGNDPFSLDVHLLRKVPEVAVSPESLTEIIAGQDVHVPDL